MSRQTYVAMTGVDEGVFLAYLREHADIQLFVNSAPTERDLLVDTFEPYHKGGHHFIWQYYIWNRAFPWTPEIGHVALDAPVTHRRGWPYVKLGYGPVVEYDRHNFENPLSRGRVYWPKPSHAPYDLVAFSKWFDSMVRWIRKHGRQERAGAYGTYYLPDAWRFVEGAQRSGIGG